MSSVSGKTCDTFLQPRTKRDAAEAHVDTLMNESPPCPTSA